MIHSIDYLIGYHCAPVIRGVKLANLVAIPTSMRDDFFNVLISYNEKYRDKGIRFAALCQCEKRQLLLVYRPHLLRAYLRKPAVRQFLMTMGYERLGNLDADLQYLASRIECGEYFPHELGLFLGYPLDDVRAFIAKRGAGYLCCDEWKVYNNVERAQMSFYCFRVCRAYCQQAMEAGQSLESLITVSAC